VKRTLFLLAALILICGCAKHVDDSAKVGGGHPIGSKGLPKGWTRVASGDGDVSIGLPPGWKAVELSAGSLRNRMKKDALIDKRGPATSQAQEKILDQGGLKLVFAGQLAAGEAVMPTGGIIAVHTTADLDTVVEKNKESIADGASDMVITDDVLIDYPAKVMSYTKTDHKGNLMDHISYYGLRGETYYICSFGFPHGTANEKEVAMRIASTMAAN
jgi:hypothetical protein